MLARRTNPCSERRLEVSSIMRKYIATVAGEKREVSIEAKEGGRFEVKIGSETILVDESDVTLINQSPAVYHTRQEGPGQFVVELDAHHIPVELEDARSAALKKHSKASSGRVILRAPMPGKISRLLVKEGDTVKEKQGVVVLEAMKMENELKSPIAGVVVKILSKDRIGTTANGNEELAIIESAS
jgi:biotin carboxyl carrier protein